MGRARARCLARATTATAVAKSKQHQSNQFEWLCWVHVVDMAMDVCRFLVNVFLFSVRNCKKNKNQNRLFSWRSLWWLFGIYFRFATVEIHITVSADQIHSPVRFSWMNSHHRFNALIQYKIPSCRIWGNIRCPRPACMEHSCTRSHFCPRTTALHIIIIISDSFVMYKYIYRILSVSWISFYSSHSSESKTDTRIAVR